jgi:hypothetical protein
LTLSVDELAAAAGLCAGRAAIDSAIVAAEMLGPIAVCPEGQFEFEQAALAARVATEQHLPFT